MSIYKPSELQLFLSELGISPKKGLSQNFLIDGNILRKIVSSAQVQPEDIVLEIGPGPGSLTQILLETGAQVIAVEKDTVLANALKRFESPKNKLEIYCSDILAFPIEDHFRPEEKVKVIANLPYNVTTPILTYLISKREYFSSFTLMVQEEVARRFAAEPGNKDYSSLTVFLNFYTNPRYAFSVSRNCFYPAPSVDSAVVQLELKTPPSIKDESAFFQMTRLAFGHRRKMLRASLKPLFNPADIMSALEKIGLSPLARPEALSLNDFVQLHNELRESE